MEELATVKGVGFGMRDCNRPVLWFGVETLHGGSLQVFNMKDAERVIQDAGCYDVKNLEGRSCVVETKNGVQAFARWK